VNNQIRTIKAELYLKADCATAEGPVWDNEVLYWLDIPGKALYSKPDTCERATRYALPDEPGALAPWDEDRLVLATENGFQEFNLRTAAVKPLFDPEADLPDNRFNDGKCDPAGRFVAGTLNRSGRPEASLYSFDGNKSAAKIFSPLTCSNGLAWSATGTTLYHIDTPTNFVRSFHYDLATGALGDYEIVIQIPKAHGKPDGMTIDRDGNLWIALWEGWGLECWNPRTGEQLARIDVPAARSSCCVFGGKTFDTLFITTAKPAEARDPKQEMAGSIFCARPEVQGFAPNRFRPQT
jgi:sugar lactone lactonase YvrE